jgi:DNA methylase/SNF2-related domain
MSYTEFLQTKQVYAPAAGFVVAPDALHAALRPDQRYVVCQALERGRAALFLDTGMGKTIDQLEWARHVAAHTGRPVLVLAPLAVAHQTVREGRKIDLAVRYVRGQDAVVDAGVYVTNYEMVDAFAADLFGGVVLDESSILKAYSSATRKKLQRLFRDTPYKLCATATPAPNDHIELSNHAEFLGILTGAEMLARWFINDSMKAENYRLKHHARADFWRWVTTWAVCAARPSDLGFDDAGFVLPDLQLIPQVVEVDHARAQASGQLFVNGTHNATTLWKEKAATAADRCAAAAAVIAAEPDQAWAVWCDTNDEADRLLALLPGDDVVEVRGSDTVAEKERKLRAFSEGEARVIITKADIAGFGLNWQHCARTCFVGVTYSYEKLYQALRRMWRYGQQRPVVAHLIYAESEGSVMDTITRKQREHSTMQSEMVAAQRLALQSAGDAVGRAPVEEDVAVGDGWTLHLGDCVTSARHIADGSVDFTIYSPPFAELYVYSDSEADMGNSRDAEEFFAHYRYLVPELLRVTRPGRLVAIHCKDLPTYKNRHGASGLYDFPGDLVRAMEETKGAPDAAERGFFHFHSRVAIWKDPVIEAQRTNNHGLLFRNFSERAEVVRQGMADYMLIFRKWAPEMPEKQVAQRRTPGDYIGTVPPPASIDNDRDYGIAVWQRYASPVWFDIDQTDVLNYQIARENEDEKHLCPLQLGVIRRCIDLWTNPGDLVFSPFAGVGSEGYVALEEGRRFVGIELKRAYWQHAQRYLADAAFAKAQPTMFDLFDQAA